MVRRSLALTLLLLVAVHMLGAIAIASDCVEPCGDEGAEERCPPACAVCMTCAHPQQAIVQSTAAVTPLQIARDAFHEQAAGAPSHLADDIFHVPLAA